MSTSTVFAVVTAKIEIHVRPSNGGEKLEDLMEVAKREAEGILRGYLPGEVKVIGPVEFSHAVVRAN